MRGPIVVIKVGGSLLDWPELPARLSAYLQSRRSDRLVIVVGGGRFADVLRDLDASLNIGETASHALALRVLDLTAHLMQQILPGTKVIDETSQLEEIWESEHVPILSPRRFLDRDERSRDPLPQAWTTTTDSIAARLAFRIEAREFVLLKSVDVVDGIGIQEASDLGIVDPEFPKAVAGVPLVTFRNLRSPGSDGLNDKGHRPT